MSQDQVYNRLVLTAKVNYEIALIAPKIRCDYVLHIKPYVHNNTILHQNQKCHPCGLSVTDNLDEIFFAKSEYLCQGLCG